MREILRVYLIRRPAPRMRLDEDMRCGKVKREVAVKQYKDEVVCLTACLESFFYGMG